MSDRCVCCSRKKTHTLSLVGPTRFVELFLLDTCVGKVVRVCGDTARLVLWTTMERCSQYQSSVSTCILFISAFLVPELRQTRYETVSTSLTLLTVLNLEVLILTCIRELSDWESAWFSSAHRSESQTSILKQNSKDLLQIPSSTYDSVKFLLLEIICCLSYVFVTSILSYRNSEYTEPYRHRFLLFRIMMLN